MEEPVLRKHTHDPEVGDLQKALKELGYYAGHLDGVFGVKTEEAVMAFQTDRGITADGVVGPITWLHIDEADESEPVLKFGSVGLPVRRAQKRMTLAHYDTGGVDGNYGAKTESAVRKLQGDHELSVDGIVGPQTWARINALGD